MILTYFPGMVLLPGLYEVGIQMTVIEDLFLLVP